MALWPYVSVALWLMIAVALWPCGSVALWPRSARVYVDGDIPDFQDFSYFFAHRSCPLVSFDLKLCVFVGHH